MKVYVGNLSSETTQSQLHHAFEQYGAVGEVKMVPGINDKRTLGFGFVHMTTGEHATAAIQGLHGSLLDGQVLLVAEARLPWSRNQRESVEVRP